MTLTRRFFLGALAAALLSACSAPSAQPSTNTAVPTVPGEQPAATAVSAYPGPGATGAYPGPGATGAYPAPGNEPPAPTVSMEPIIVPQPASGEVGITTGTLYRIDGENRIPITNATLYLGALLQTAEGVDAMVQMDRNVAPKTITNGLGQFLFLDLPPGRYGLMLDAIEGALLLNQPDDGTDLIIEVTGGQVNDLGELAYPFPELN